MVFRTELGDITRTSVNIRVVKASYAYQDMGGICLPISSRCLGST